MQLLILMAGVLAVIVGTVTIIRELYYSLLPRQERDRLSTLPDDPTKEEFKKYLRDKSEMRFGTRDLKESNRRADVLLEWREEQ